MSELSKIVFINRKPCGYVSIERVFDQVSASLRDDGFATETTSLHFGSGLLGVILNLLTFKPPKSDIYHVTGHTHFICLRLPKRKTVLTIHDLRFLAHTNPLKRWFLRKLFLEWPVGSAEIVTAVSETTREAILRETSCSPEKVTVVSNPIRSEFLDVVHTSSKRERKVVLHIGTMANKNLGNLIAALKGVPCILHVVGELDSDQRRLLDSSVEYVNTAYLDTQGMLNAYLDADVLSFCSTFEGFGLPIIEAQAVGLPVVTSDVEPLKEVAGGAAILVDPMDPESIRKGILEVLNDSKKREELERKGRENVKRYLPETIATAYQSVYSRLKCGGFGE